MTTGSNEGYIYVYKCVVANRMDVCKIGQTANLGNNNDRMMQHARTPYCGFVAYANFFTGRPIFTAFKVRDVNVSDDLVRSRFKEHQMTGIEIFNIDYNIVIKELYRFLKLHNQFIEVVEDGISTYDFIDSNVNSKDIDTSKSRFIDIKQRILSKYEDMLPDMLLSLLKDKDEFETNCYSHFKCGNYIDFPGGLVLDTHVSKSERINIINKLCELL